jgi:hypothetical protein
LGDKRDLEILPRNEWLNYARSILGSSCLLPLMETFEHKSINKEYVGYESVFPRKKIKMDVVA